MTEILEYLNDFSSNKFKTQKGTIRYHDKTKMIIDSRYNIVNNFLKTKYLDDKIGIKSLIKEYNLPITYSKLRYYLLNILNVKLRSTSEITPWLRVKRSNKCKEEFNNGTGWYSEDTIRKNTKRGYQGYYYSTTQKCNVWLRSSYEYIYAKHLDSINANWKIEFKSYKLINGSTYKPDFFIFDNNDNLIKIIEVKGWWKNRLDKYFMLEEQLKNTISMELLKLEQLKTYTSNFNKDVEYWKQNRKNKKI